MKYPGFTKFLQIDDPSQAPDGWTLVDVFAMPPMLYASYYPGGSANLGTNTPRPMYLFGLNEEAHVAKLANELGLAKDALRVEGEAKDKVLLDLKEAQSALKGEVDSYRDLVNLRRYDEEKLQKAKALEKDIAKIRIAIGGHAMDCILRDETVLLFK